MKFFSGSIKLVASAGSVLLLSTLAGCSLGSIQLSGPAPVTSVAVNMTGKVHGGQQPVKGAKIQLWAVGSGSYGAAAHELTSTSTTNYHPGGATGCSTTAINIGSLAITSNVVTAYGTGAALAVGDYVTFAGFGTAFGKAVENSGQFIVASVSGTSFTAQSLAGFTYADTAQTTDTGSATATCYSYVVSDYNGNYSLTGDYACGAYTGSNVYITASGGNPGLVGGTNNTAIKMVDLLYGTPASTGAPVPLTCSGLTSATSSFINEVTTAAASVALAQYYGNGGFGGPSSTQGALGFNNAFITAGLLASPSTGNAVTSTSLTGGTGAGTVVATPDPNKIYTIADVLAACVNSSGTTSTGAASTANDGTNCGTLFGGVVPTGGAAVTDTLAAAVDLTLNPISNNANGSANNLTALFGLAQGTGAPYPMVASQVTDWTIGINYVDATALVQPLDLAADSNGNIWVISSSSGLAEISPAGSPTFYSNAFGSTGLALTGPRNVALDTANNVYVASSSSPYNEIKYTPGTAATAATVLTPTSTLNKSPYGLAIDGNNDVFFGLQSSSAAVEVVEFPAGNFSLTGDVTFPLDGGNDTTVAPEYMAVDTAGNLWMDDGSSSTITGVTTNSNLTQLTGIAAANAACASSGYPCTVASGTVTYNNYAVTGVNEPWGLAANNGTMWAANAGAGADSVTSVTLAGANSTGSPYTPSTLTTASPHYLAVDGTGNVWVANKNTGSAPYGGTVAEFSSTGALLSGLGTATTPGGFNHVGLNSGEGIAVDPSGNVWIANNTAGYGIEEIVGTASPAVTPIALALHNGTVAAKP